MQTITLNNALKDLPGLIASTISNNEETCIVTELGTVIMVDKAEWESQQETLLLLNDRKALMALLESHIARDKGETPKYENMEDLFPV